MSQPSYRWGSQVMSLPTDSAGRRFFTGQLFDVLNGAIELRIEELMTALFEVGGLTHVEDVQLAANVVTVTGPASGISMDGRTPVLVDPAGTDVTLDLAVAGSGLGDGTHLIVMTPLPVTEGFPFDTPPIATRDEAGNVIAETSSEPITYTLRRYLGQLAVRDGTSPEPEDVPLATAIKSGSSWGTLTTLLNPPRLRAQVQDTVTVVYDSGWPADRPNAAHVYAAGGPSAPSWLEAWDIWLEEI